VTGAGPNWLKVNSREGGVDVPFVTDPNRYNALYRIATEVEGSKEFKKISELPEKVFLRTGTRYQLVSDPMPSCWWTGKAGKGWPRQQRVTEGDEWVTEILDKNKQLIGSGTGLHHDAYFMGRGRRC
jgi:hypothetical protein